MHGWKYPSGNRPPQDEATLNHVGTFDSAWRGTATQSRHKRFRRYCTRSPRENTVPGTYADQLPFGPDWDAGAAAPIGQPEQLDLPEWVPDPQGCLRAADDAPPESWDQEMELIAEAVRAVMPDQAEKPEEEDQPVEDWEAEIRVWEYRPPSPTSEPETDESEYETADEESWTEAKAV